MKLPNGDKAVIDMRKLTGYVLNPDHVERGVHKARLFQSILGMTSADAYTLRGALLEAARTEEARPGTYVEYGQTYKVLFLATGPTGLQGTVTSTWIFDPGSDVPRFVTAWPLKSSKT